MPTTPAFCPRPRRGSSNTLLRRQHRTTPVSPYYLALIALGLGETDRGYELLQQAYAERDGVMIYLPVDPVTRTFSSDPRIKDLLQKIGLPD